MHNDDADLVYIINKSTLTPEDKSHWISILSKMTSPQKEILRHSLIVKTEIKTAISLIDKALNVISDAETEADKQNEADYSITEDDKMPPVTEPDISEGVPITQTASKPQNPAQQSLIDEKTMQEQKLAEIREELKKISLEAHGSAPPSYNNS